MMKLGWATTRTKTLDVAGRQRVVLFLLLPQPTPWCIRRDAIYPLLPVAAGTDSSKPPQKKQCF
jgi:hypothetical protein